MKSIESDVLLFLVNGILMILTTLVFGIGLIFGKIGTGAKKSRAVRAETPSGRSLREMDESVKRKT